MELKLRKWLLERQQNLPRKIPKVAKHFYIPSITPNMAEYITTNKVLQLAGCVPFCDKSSRELTCETCYLRYHSSCIEDKKLIKQNNEDDFIIPECPACITRQTL